MKILTVSSSIGGRRFEPQQERLLHHLAEHAASSIGGKSQEVLLVPEMPSPLGLPDFIAVLGGQEWLRARIESGIPPILAEADSQVLAELRSAQAFKIETLARRVGWSVTELEPVLTRLKRINAVLTTERGAYLLNPVLMPHGSLVAFEAKVKDWQKAIYQGRSYRTWADNYVVILGNVGNIAASRAKETIGRDGAGLYSPGGWVVRPKARRSVLSRRLRGFEYLYSAVNRSKPSFSLGKSIDTI